MSFESQSMHEEQGPYVFSNVIRDIDITRFPTWTSPVNEEDSLTVIEAMEQNRVTDYLGSHTSDEQIELVNMLVHIYDECKKDTPDDAIIDQATQELRNRLR